MNLLKRLFRVIHYKQKQIKFMKTTVKQVETYSRLVGLCTENGSMFNPAKDSIKIEALESLLATARQKHQMVNDTHHTLMSAINNRNDALIEMRSKCTRAANAAVVLIDQPSLIEDIKKNLSKIRGYRLGAQQVKDAPSETGPPGQEFKKSRGPIAYLTISSKLDHFDKFIKCLNTPAYTPNEPDITYEGLHAFLAEIKVMQSQVSTGWSANRMARDQFSAIVHSADGIYGISKLIKTYIKSVFGPSSNAYHIVRQLKFR